MDVKKIMTLEDANRYVEGCINDFESGISTKGETMSLLGEYTGRLMELFWENSIKYKIVKKDFGHDKKISRLTLLRKFFSKLFRNIVR